MPRAKTFKPKPASETKPATAAPRTAQPAADKPARGSKRAAVLVLLRCEQGATMAELTLATGWQPHSTRAFITGLRKDGHVVTRTRRDTETCYQIAEQT